METDLPRHLSKLFRSGINGLEGTEKVRRTILINQISTVFICAAFPFTFTLVYLGYPIHAAIAIPFVLIYAYCIALNHFKRYDLSAFLLLSAIAIPTYIYATILGHGSGVQYVTIILSAFSFTLFNYNKIFVKIVGFSFPLLLFLILHFSIFPISSFETLPPNHNAIMYLVTLATIFTVVYLIGLFHTKTVSIYKDQNMILAKLPGVSLRESDIILKILEGKKNKAIAEELFLEEGTVKNYLSSIYRKANVSSRLELITLINKEG